MFVLLGGSAAVSLVATGACGLQPWAHLMHCQAFWRCEPSEPRALAFWFSSWLIQLWEHGWCQDETHSESGLELSCCMLVTVNFQGASFRCAFFVLRVLWIIVFIELCKEEHASFSLAKCLRRAKCPTMASFSNIVRANGCPVAGWRSTQHIGWSAFERFESDENFCFEVTEIGAYWNRVAVGKWSEHFFVMKGNPTWIFTMHRAKSEESQIHSLCTSV